MELNKFAETYFELEEKSLEIIKIFSNDKNKLNKIAIEKYDGKVLINITAKHKLNSNLVWLVTTNLTFELNEMTNDLEYFKNKKQEENEQRKKRVKEREDALEEYDLKYYKKLKRKIRKYLTI